MLKLKDAMTLSKAIDKMGIADQISGIFKDKDKESVGLKIFALLGSKLYKAESEVTAIIVSTSGKSVKEVSDMGMGELMDIIKGFFSEDGVKDFLSKYVEDSK